MKVGGPVRHSFKEDQPRTVQAKFGPVVLDYMLKVWKLTDGQQTTDASDLVKKN